MGMKPSGYVATKYAFLALEMIQGDRHEPKNPHAWDRVRLNLPGSKEYDPQVAWVSRIKTCGSLAGGVLMYIDDLRPVADSFEGCWKIGHATACGYGYLGVQISSRKMRPPSKQPGAWAGTLASASDDGIGVYCAPEKWRKAKEMLMELKAELGAGGHYCTNRWSRNVGSLYI